MNGKEPRIKFTTTLPVSVLITLDRAAEETGRKKNDILIEAVTEWIKEYRRARLAASYGDNNLE